VLFLLIAVRKNDGIHSKFGKQWLAVQRYCCHSGYTMMVFRLSRQGSNWILSIGFFGNCFKNRRHFLTAQSNCWIANRPEFL